MPSGVYPRRSLIDRFSENWIAEPFSGCWLWTGYGTVEGYGQVQENRKKVRAHRIAWKLYKGAIPQGLHVLHRCDTPSCVNPNHLFLGTHTDNMVDSVSKNRHLTGHCVGETNGNGRLVESQVREILTSSATGISLAKRFGVTASAVSAIRRRSTWKHLAKVGK